MEGDGCILCMCVALSPEELPYRHADFLLWSGVLLHMEVGLADSKEVGGV